MFYVELCVFIRLMDAMVSDSGHPNGLKEENSHFAPNLGLLINGPQSEKTCLRGFANNTGADRPEHPRSLIRAYVIRLLESIICTLATGDILIF